MTLQLNLVLSEADAAKTLCSDLTALHSRVKKFLTHNSNLAIAWSPAASKTFTVTAATDVCASTAHGFLEGQKLRISSSTEVTPLPLTEGQNVFVALPVNANDFKLSLTKGGAVIELTTTGAGTLTAFPMPDYITEDANGNLSGRTFTKAAVSNVVGSFDQFDRMMTNLSVTQGDHLGNLNQLGSPNSV